MAKSEVPSVKKTAFSCPYCGTLTSQYWYNTFGERVDREPPVPFIVNESEVEQYKKEYESEDDEFRKKIIQFVTKIASGKITVERETSRKWLDNRIINLYLARCYNCNELSIWVYDRLIYPTQKIDIEANADLPSDIASDFEEARELVNISPRAAAAILRLCIQKICKHLGQKGKNIDDDIGALVKKGLDPTIQKSLDIVRVIGNEAVHPGVLNIKDDRDIALSLFGIVNAVADQLISHPKKINALYEQLPDSKKNAISQRDKVIK